MLIKEYHIPLPMSLEEYQVAQLYMIQKKSREESSGEGSGVEILENRPYTNGPGGSGQYTHKIYHVGSHIPSWFRALLPKAALQVEEESWNAYPYTRTRYTCPFVEKFSIEIETFYRPDAGNTTNAFNLTTAEKRQRIVDTIDIVRDAISMGEYKVEEDPKLYRSAKTGRGPLGDDWIEELAHQAIMCAYKLCKVEFRYWGMQSKIEQFIHDVGLRKVMLRAHRQAWCWQDEWCELTMDDIRQLEDETARMLAQKMAKCAEDALKEAPVPSLDSREEAGDGPVKEGAEPKGVLDVTPDDSLTKQWSTSSRSSYSSQHGGVSPQSFSEWRMQNIARDSENSSDEEFFDAHDFSDTDEVFPKEITKWNSNDFLDSYDAPGDSEDSADVSGVPQNFSSEGLQTEGYLEDGSPRSLSEIHVLFLILHSGNILDLGGADHASKQADVHTLSAAFDGVMRMHFPEALGHIALRLVPCPPICAEAYALVSNLSPYSYDTDSMSSSQDHIPLAALPLLATSSMHYQNAVSTTFARVNQAYHDFLRSREGTGFCGQVVLIGDCVGGILAFDVLCHSGSLLSSSRGSSRRGSVSMELLSPGTYMGKDPLADAADLPGRSSPEQTASMAEGAGLQLPRKRSDTSSPELDGRQPPTFTSSLQASVPKTDSDSRRSSSSPVPPTSPSPTSASPTTAIASVDLGEPTSKLDFKVSGLFLFGSPLGLVLALRKTVMPAMDVSQMRPACEQIYNLFHSADPCASRLEPLLAKKFHAISPFMVPRYQKFPLGDGNSSLLEDALQMHSPLFLDDLEVVAPTTPTGAFSGFWKSNELSICCEGAGTGDTVSEVVKILERWWGTKRIDYTLYCPDALTAFPTVTLPHLFHASYWESTDVVAFILRQVMEKETPPLPECEETSVYSPSIPRERWQRKRTLVKIRNVTSNHRSSDAIVLEGRPQLLTGRFMYGPLDVVTLTGEKVDVYIMVQPLSGKWIYFGTEVTTNSGRISFTIPEKQLGIGMYPVRMVVRGDHTYAESYLTVVAKNTQCVVFSIDGSFTASVSIMGSDPKVRAGAVDVVRHWQDSGFMIVYVTGRPDMQKYRVVAWLSQHNFPHGIVSFCDGLTHDPLRQKAVFLQSLVQEVGLSIVAGYGSTKDIPMYSALGLAPSQIYIVGRAVKKLHSQCQFLSEGYVAHLAQLEATSQAHSPKGNHPRAGLAKGAYGCPGPVNFLRKQSHLLRSRHTVSEKGSSDREAATGGGGSGTTPPPGLVRGKPRSVSLKLESEG